MPPNPTESQASESRIIGRLEGAAERLQASLDRVLDGQVRVEQKLDAHAEEDRRVQEKLADGIGGLRDRIARVEMVADAVDSHGDAIAALERRQSASETVLEVQAKVRANNLKWISVAATAGAAAGSASTSIWPKFWAAISSAFKP